MDKRITVVVRIRPALQNERFQPLCVRKADDGRTVIVNDEDAIGGPTAFLFDDVFDAIDDQRSVYTESVQDLLDYTLQGGNTTVLTYGQTGSGKTFTILGCMEEQDLGEKSGVFPRVFYDIFSYRESVKDKLHIIVFISAVELYLDDVMDLLAKRKKIKLRETAEETLIPGLNIVEVVTMADVLQTFEMANTCRSVTSTKMNDVSSRSHALFFINIFQVQKDVCPQRPKKEQLIDSNGLFNSEDVKGLVRSRITLVDLAGSERVKRSGAQGQTMLEAQSINKSLSALGTTINALYVGNSHIPFRESRLTLLLKPSFIDRRSRLLLIGQIAPPASSAQESQGTLRFCDRVKALKVGKVTGFYDPAEEEKYLKVLREQEEIAADMRIVREKFYYEPQRPLALAQLKKISVAQARGMSIATLQENRDQVVAQKEEEFLKKKEAEIMSREEKMLQAYVEKMNKMIEEYELLAREVKNEKKSIKQLTKESEATKDEKLAEAKKAKKQRLKLEETFEQMKEKLQNAEKTLNEVDVEGCNNSTVDVDEKKSGGDLTKSDNSNDELIDMLLNCFCAHAKELNGLHYLYVQRLGATQRQRSQVRRLKLLSSEIIIEGTLVYDIIDFIVDRAVDIASGVISYEHGYSWNDIDGLSTVLRGWEKLYPPLLTTIPEGAGTREPSLYHNTTFLSSDESDEENSHNRDKTRRRSPADGNMHLADGDDDQVNSKGNEHLRAGDKKTQNAGTAGALSKELGIRDSTKNSKSDQIGDNGNRNNKYNNGDGAQGKQTVMMKCGAAAESRTASVENGAISGNRGDGHLVNGNRSSSGDNLENTNLQEQETSKRRDQDYLMRVYDSPTLVVDLIKYLRGGTVMLKHGRTGKPHRRFFWVTTAQGQKMLRWADPDRKNTTDHAAVDLDDVSYIQLGCFSKVFKRHQVPPTDPSFYRAFSIGLKNGGRTVDIVADSMPDFEAWVVGLSNLVRVDPVWGGKLDITKEEQFERLNCFEAALCESTYIYPTQYLSLKKRVLCLVSKTLETLAQCGNDAKEAHKILCGIHIPAVNDKGAVYLTKGELRFIGQTEIDIIRITKVWILFQQMNLVYDENFIPATTFGITHRE